MSLIISLVLLISLLLLPARATSEIPASDIFRQAMDTPEEQQNFLERYIRGLPVVMSGLNDVEEPDSLIPFSTTLRDGQSVMKRQQGEEKNTFTESELFIAKHGKRKEGCKFLYWKSWTAC